MAKPKKRLTNNTAAPTESYVVFEVTFGGEGPSLSARITRDSPKGALSCGGD